MHLELDRSVTTSPFNFDARPNLTRQPPEPRTLDRQCLFRMILEWPTDDRRTMLTQLQFTYPRVGTHEDTQEPRRIVNSSAAWGRGPVRSLVEVGGSSTNKLYTTRRESRHEPTIRLHTGRTITRGTPRSTARSGDVKPNKFIKAQSPRIVYRYARGASVHQPVPPV